MRLYSRNAPYAMHRILADLQFPRQFTDRPVSRTVFWFAAGSLQNPRLEFGCNHGRLLPRMPHLDQTINSGIEEALLPSGDGRSGRLQAFLDFRITAATGQHQDHSGSQHITGWQTP